MYTNRNLFRQTGLQKCEESQQLFFGLRLERRISEETLNISQSKPKYCNTLADFLSNKSAPANRKKGFCTNRDPNKQEVRGFFILSG
jgi:hypothetical protein